MSAVLYQLRLFFIALQFYTRVPIPAWVGFQPEWLQHSIRYFPAVGVLVGVVTAATYALASLIWPSLVAAVLCTIVGIYLTGAFHEDGFADVCDGLGGGYTRERMLEIMRDSRIGAYGAIGIGLLLLLKCVTLASIGASLAVASLLLAHPLSRLAALALVWRLDYVRQEGKVKPMAQQVTQGEFLFAVLTVLAVALALGFAGWLAWQVMVVALIAAALAATYLARKFVQHLGGYTGDCLGAVQQTSEAAIYLALLAMV